jgi:3',5'-cyclic AMP phosphodiesterase CpdA
MTAMMPHRVAIIADAHFHDPKGDFGGVGVAVGGEHLALRSWEDVQNGPRAVNETATALTAAVEWIARLGIRHIILAGDYTDDGQVENTRRLARLLESFQTTHGLRLYAIPGNHDVYGPWGKHVSTRFMTGPDTSVIVTSDPAMAADNASVVVLTPAMRCEGQPVALRPMARFGFYRQPADLHWESPFGLSDEDDARQYIAVAADGSVAHPLMDASYLVEPEPGLWLLMIDANVFEPRSGITDPTRKKAFLDASNAGWNAVLRAKPFLISWIGDVVTRARAQGKTLVTVSHYPVIDPFQDDAGSEVAMFGKTAIALRTPAHHVAEALSATGLRWHVGGHMHVNATNNVQTAAGIFTDVALPSLAAFPPAFKIVTATPRSTRIQTYLLGDVPEDPRLSDFYTMQGRTTQPMDYGPFLATQYRSHVITRLLPRDWPPDLLAMIEGMDCTALLVFLGTADPALFARQHALNQEALSAYPVQQMIADAHLIRNAGALATDFVQPDRVRICRAFANEFGDATIDPQMSHAAFLKRFLSILRVSLDRMDAPADAAW